MNSVEPQKEEKKNESDNWVICSVNDYQRVAKLKLSKAIYEYLASGTDDEQTLMENRSAFKHWYIRPRVLRPVPHVSTRTKLCFGGAGAATTKEFEMNLPLFISPAGLHALCDPEGECTSVQAAGEMGIPFGISQHSTRSIEEIAVAAAAQPFPTILWYQAYILRQKDITVHLLERARRAGCQAMILTVDSVRFGYREADARNGFDSLPPPHRLVNYDAYNNNKSDSSSSSSSSSLDQTYNAKIHKSWDQNSELMFEQNLTWDHVRWFKQLPACQGLPLIIKGIMTAEDAILAVEAGADAIMVSNHGGRQLDGCLASIDALPEIVQALRQHGDGDDDVHVPILLDGGIRRGTDILKALALGASAVGIGKPLFFALATGGKPAVLNMLQLFQKELEAAMALTGCQTIADISPSLITLHPHASGRPQEFIRSAL